MFHKRPIWSYRINGFGFYIVPNQSNAGTAKRPQFHVAFCRSSTYAATTMKHQDFPFWFVKIHAACVSRDMSHTAVLRSLFVSCESLFYFFSPFHRLFSILSHSRLRQTSILHTVNDSGRHRVWARWRMDSLGSSSCHTYRGCTGEPNADGLIRA